MQTESGTVRTDCFSPEKHETFKRSFEASSPVKLSQFQLKPNRQTNEEEQSLTIYLSMKFLLTLQQKKLIMPQQRPLCVMQRKLSLEERSLFLVD